MKKNLIFRKSLPVTKNSFDEAVFGWVITNDLISQIQNKRFAGPMITILYKAASLFPLSAPINVGKKLKISSFNT